MTSHKTWPPLDGPMYRSGSHCSENPTSGSLCSPPGGSTQSSPRDMWTLAGSPSPRPTDGGKDAGGVKGQYDKYARERQQSSDVEQLMRFVRGQQHGSHEVIDIKLTRKAPLPGIGQHADPSGNHHSRHKGARADTGESAGDSDSYQDSDSDKELNNIYTRQTPGLDLAGSRLSHKTVTSRSKQKVSRTRSEPMRRATADVHLPPLERDELPARPSAPPPSITPPPLDSEGEQLDREEHEDSEGEQLDREEH